MDIIIPYTLGLSYGIVIDFGLNEIRIGCYCSGGGGDGNYGSSYSSLEFINIGKDFIFKTITKTLIASIQIRGNRNGLL